MAGKIINTTREQEIPETFESLKLSQDMPFYRILQRVQGKDILYMGHYVRVEFAQEQPKNFPNSANVRVIAYNPKDLELNIDKTRTIESLEQLEEVVNCLSDWLVMVGSRPGGA